MAEAAAVVGFAGFGIQCIESVLKFRKFVHNIKDAPSDIVRLLRDIEDLRNTINDIAQQHHASVLCFPNQPPVRDSVRERCDEAAAEIEQICSATLKSMQKSKFKGSVSSALQKEVLNDYRRRLESRKTTLILAQVALTNSLFRYAMLNGITIPLSTPSPAELCLPPAPVEAQSHPHQSFQQHDESLDTALCVYRKDAQGSCAAMTVAYVSAPATEAQARVIAIGSRWLGRIIKVHIQKAYCTMGINLTFHSIVPKNAKVFAAVREGNVDTLRYLLDNREASIYDITDTDQGLLEAACHLEIVASTEQRLAVVRILLGLGLRPGHETHKAFWGSSALCSRSSLPVVEMARVLLSHSRHLLLEHPSDYNVMLWGNAEAQSLLCKHLNPPYSQWPVSARVKILQKYIKTYYMDSKNFKTWMGQEVFDAKIVGALGVDGWWDVLHRLATFDSTDNFRHEVLGTLRQSWDFPLLLSTFSSESESQMRSHLCTEGRFSTTDEIEVTSNAGLRRWLLTLQEAGLDLVAYGEVEHSIWSRGANFDWKRLHSRHPAMDDELRVVGFSYGPSVADWRSYFDCPYDQWCEEFWSMPEPEPHLEIPCSWVEEDEQSAFELRCQPGLFNSLATSRRKRRRYLRMMKMTDEEAQSRLGFGWKYGPELNSRSRTSMFSDLWRSWPPLGTQMRFFCMICEDYVRQDEYWTVDEKGNFYGNVCHGSRTPWNEDCGGINWRNRWLRMKDVLY